MVAKAIVSWLLKHLTQTVLSNLLFLNLWHVSGTTFLSGNWNLTGLKKISISTIFQYPIYFITGFLNNLKAYRYCIETCYYSLI